MSTSREIGFETSCRIQQKALDKEKTIHTLGGPADDIFSPVQLDRDHVPQLTAISDGLLKGFTRLTMRFVANVGQRLVQVTLVVYAKTIELAQEFQTQIRALLGGSPLSLADAVTAARVQLKKTHNLSDEELSDQLRLEIGGTIIVETLSVGPVMA